MSNVDYTAINDQIGGGLAMLQKHFAMIKHLRDSDNANYNRRLLVTNYSTTSNEEAAAKDIVENAQNSILSTAVANYNAQRTAFAAGLTSLLDSTQKGIPTSAKDKAGGMISYEYDAALEATGQISIIRRRGRLGALYHDMEGNSQNVLENTITFGSLTAVSGNTGSCAFSVSPTGESHALSGTATIECMDDTIGYTKFSLKNDVWTQLPDGTRTRFADKQAQIGYAYQDGPTGISFTMGYGTIVEVDPSGVISGTGSGFVVTNPNETNTDKGIIHLKATRRASAPIWLIEWFNDSSREPSEKVASTTTTGTVGTTSGVTMTGTNGMTVKFNFYLAGAHAAMPNAGDTLSNFSLDIDAPRVSDKWTFTVSNDEAGQYQTKIAQAYAFSFPDGAAASANFTDTKANSITMT